MKIVVFGPENRVGAWVDEEIVEVGRDLGAFIEGGAAALEAAARAVATRSGAVHRRADVQLHAPHVRGARILCAGGNFADHAAAMAHRTGDNALAPEQLKAAAEKLRAGGIWGFWKVGRDAALPGGDVLYPARTKRLDYEGEVAIVIGKQVKNFNAKDDIAPYVWGVTLFGDWSIRDQREPDSPLKIGMSKNFDGSYSIGPCIVAGETLDPGNVDCETYVNGDRRQQFNTRDMIFSFAEFLAYVTADFTLYPGDVISGGTAKGTAADSSPRLPDGTAAPDRFLKPGDRVEIRSARIGTLAATIAAR